MLGWETEQTWYPPTKASETQDYGQNRTQRSAWLDQAVVEEMNQKPKKKSAPARPPRRAQTRGKTAKKKLDTTAQGGYHVIPHPSIADFVGNGRNMVSPL